MLSTSFLTQGYVTEQEPLLKASQDRFVLYPIKYPEV